MSYELWDKLEIASLVLLYPQGDMPVMIFILGKTRKSIEAKAQRLGIKQDWRVRQKTLIKVACERNDG